jgi:CBS-domain-containing membrane protein
MGKPRTVGEIMRREFVSLQASDRLDFVEDVMSLGRIRHLPVVDNGKLVGIVSHRDLLANSLSRAIEFDPTDRRTFLRSVDVSEAMARNVITVDRKTPVEEAARLMLRHRVGCLPVVDEEGAPVGLVTETDLIRAAYLDDET